MQKTQTNCYTNSYDFEPKATTAMLALLNQFGPDLDAVNEIKEKLRTSPVSLEVHHAIILARLITPFYPDYAEQLLAPLRISLISPPPAAGKFSDMLDIR